MNKALCELLPNRKNKSQNPDASIAHSCEKLYVLGLNAISGSVSFSIRRDNGHFVFEYLQGRSIFSQGSN